MIYAVILNGLSMIAILSHPPSPFLPTVIPYFYYHPFHRGEHMFRSPQSSTLPQCSSDLLDRGGEGDRDSERECIWAIIVRAGHKCNECNASDRDESSEVTYWMYERVAYRAAAGSLTVGYAWYLLLARAMHGIRMKWITPFGLTPVSRDRGNRGSLGLLLVFHANCHKEALWISDWLLGGEHIDYQG